MRRVFTIVLAICSGCGQVPVQADLSTSIHEAISKGDSTILDLGNLASFEWDEVCFLGPFMRPVDITAELGFEWKGKRSGAGGSFVFVDVRSPRADSVATGHLPIRRNQWFVQASGCIPRADAKFLVLAQSGEPATLVPIGVTKQKQPLTPFR